jgi:peptide-methionine (R)-S-oxide reductase
MSVSVEACREDWAMMTRRFLLTQSTVGVGAAWFSPWWITAVRGETFEITHTDAEWRKLLTPDQFAVLRKSGTSPLLHEERHGNFVCAGCDLDLFSSTTKFDSRTGWPSFWAPLDKAIGTTKDATFGMVRTAVHCNRCGGHLGHVFNDGPKPTGLRYCMNGSALTFKPVDA